MSNASEEVRCQRCGEIMEAGIATALGLLGGNSPSGDPKLVFVVIGEPTSANPIKAFQQGLEGDRTHEAFRLRGYRCPGCGTVELVARDKIPWTP